MSASIVRLGQVNPWFGALTGCVEGVRSCAWRRIGNVAPALLTVVALVLAMPQSQASVQLAFDKGCYNCHGNPPKKNVPPFAKVAEQYGKYRSQPEVEHRLAEKLRTGSIFGHVDAHERLSHDDAEQLVRWLIGGAK